MTQECIHLARPPRNVSQGSLTLALFSSERVRLFPTPSLSLAAPGEERSAGQISRERLWRREHQREHFGAESELWSQKQDQGAGLLRGWLVFPGRWGLF